LEENYRQKKRKSSYLNKSFYNYIMSSTKNIYALPFKKKDSIIAISDPQVHFAPFEHAIDFIMPKGTEILASKYGIVAGIKVDSKEGGSNPKYNSIYYLNYMTLKHSNGEFSEYGHLKHNGALVKLGQKVKTGQPIALSGNTGFSDGPHLHFQVGRYCKTRIGIETLKIRFKEKVVVDRTEEPITKKFKSSMKEVERTKKIIEQMS